MKHPKPLKRPRLSEQRRYDANCRTESVESIVRPVDPGSNDILYADFVAWMNYKKITSEQFRYITHKYYNEFIRGL